ncbi:MAG: hypothetical protein Q4G70_04675 [Pseudomonadota bacterium]|nr:hypothetical protein [Pseudomonadota bacterium]
MSTLRLGAYKLPAAEVVLVQTLFRLYAHGDAFRWTFVTSPPYDALLVDGTTEEGLSSAVDGMAKAVLRLTRMNAGDAPNTLGRPIRADRLQAWLKLVEADLLDTRATTPLDEATELGPATGDPANMAETAINPLRFKLRRWPPAALLRADPNRIRMATLLSRRPLNAAELATISQQPLQECQAFLNTLQTTGLVDIQRDEPAATPAAGPPAKASATPAAPAPAFARGLISGIRRRLGL